MRFCKRKRDEVFQEVAESNMPGVEADMESDCTPVNADMSDSPSMRSLFGRLVCHST